MFSFLFTIISISLRDLSNWSVVAALVIGLLIVKRLSRTSRIILLLLALASIPQVINAVATTSAIKSLIYNLYTVAEFFITWELFRNKFILNFSKVVWKTSLVLYILISGWMVYYFNIKIHFVAEWVCVNNFFYLLWILFYMNDAVRDEQNQFNIAEPFIIYILAIVLYACATILYFSVGNYIQNHPESRLKHLETVHDISNILMYVLFAIGMCWDAANNAKQKNKPYHK